MAADTAEKASASPQIDLQRYTQPLFSPTFLWKVGEKRGRRLAACNGTSTFREANPASLRSSAPSRGRGAKSLSLAVRDSRFSHMCRAVPLFSSVFHTACALSAPAGHLPLEGKADGTGIASSKKAAKPPPYNKASSTSVGMTFKKDG